MENFILKIYSIIYNILKKNLKIKKNKIAFIDNDSLNNTKYIYNYINNNLKNEFECNFITKTKKVKNYPITSMRNIKSAYHLATSEYWIVYTHLHKFLEFGIFPSKETRYIQVWHATGAIKRFGQDSKAEIIESKSILSKEGEIINSILVSSDIWKKPFSSAFRVEENKVKVLGVPRTDFFFDEKNKNSIEKKLRNDLKDIKGKKVILYAPTFRDDDLKSSDLNIDLILMEKELGDDYRIILKLHPHMKKIKLDNDLKYTIDLSTYPDINHILLISDYLITDYSSVALEFVLLDKPVIFYAYDLEHYERDIRGFYYLYEDFIIKNSLAKTTEDIIKIIKQKKIKKKDIIEFKMKNHKFLDGKSSERLVKELII
ncbi:MAG: CDP-glycerol glycerophosphotransferase family protein [Cetobacterium sp.]